MKMKKQGILSLIISGMSLCASAQHFTDPNNVNLYVEEAQRLSDEAFHYGSQNIADHNDEALRLINDYFLNTPGTEVKIARWSKANPVHPQRNRLMMMQANMMVKDGRYAEAFDIYDNMEDEAFENLPANEQTEAKLYGAIAYINTGNIDKAERMLNDIKDSKTHQADIYYYTGYIKYVKGDYREALNYFTAIEESIEYCNKAPFYIADCLQHLGQPDEALMKIHAWQTAYGTSATNKDLYLESKRIEGECYYDKGLHKDAITAFSNYVNEVESPTRTALYKMGMSEFFDHRYSEAINHLNRSADTASDAMAQNAKLHAGKAYIEMGNKRNAGIAFQQAAQMTADRNVQEEAAYNYALTLHDGANIGFGRSVEEFENFLNKYPNSKYATSVSQHLTDVYFTTKNYQAALKSINKIKNPSAEIISAKQQVLYNLGTASFAEGNYKAAKQYMAQSNATKANSEAVFWKGESEYRLGEYQNAATDYSTYLKQGKNSANRALANYGLGYISFNKKNYAEAMKYFNNYITSVGNNAEQANVKADAYNRIGDCLFTQRKFDEANASYKTAFATDKSHGDYSLLQQSVISGLKGDYNKKVELLNQLDNLYSKSEYADNALFEKGRAYVLSNDNDQALSTFKTLVSRFPKSTNARRALNEIGNIYQETGKTDLAIEQYTNIINNYPNTVEASSALESLKQIYNSQGRVSEYAAIAQKAGKPLSPAELDEMTENAAIMAMSDGDYTKALGHFMQLQYQTMSGETRVRALENAIECAEKSNDNTALVTVSSLILNNAGKVAPEKVSHARLVRAKEQMAAGNTQAAVNDYMALTNDTLTVYGAQGTVELAQYCYDTQQYAQAEQLLDRFIDTGTIHSYWLARAFVLLSDVYAQTDRKVEAREYLISLKNNYKESEEINQMIEQRLSQLNN